MVAAVGDLRRVAAVVKTRTHADAHPRRTGQGAHPPHQLQRPEHAAAGGEARREIHHFDGAAVVIVETRHQQRGVLAIALLAARMAFQLDRPVTLLLRRIGGAVEQGVKHRIAVETRQAAPDDAGIAVHQRAIGAIADDAEV